MGIFSGTLLLSDYDGTLAADGGGIHPYARARLLDYVARGGAFAVCTGRSRQGFHAYDPDIMNAPTLLCNGMCAFDHAAEQTVFAETLDASDCRILSAAAARWPAVGMEFYTAAGDTAVFRPDDRIRRHLAGQGIRFAPIDSPAKAPYPVVKLMIGGTREETTAIRAFLAANPCGALSFIPAPGEFVELLRQGGGKAAGMLRLASVLGVPPDRVYAVGDGDNDIDMLRAAAVSFAPANASDGAKEAADRRVPSNNEGAVGFAVDLLEALCR